MSTTLKGRPAAPGAAAGPSFIVESMMTPVKVVPEKWSGSSEQEITRLDTALEHAAEELQELAERVAAVASKDEAAIFEAHADFAGDPELAAQAHAAIHLGASAERAAIEAFTTFRALLTESESEYLVAREADLDDVCSRVVAILLDHDTRGPVPEERSVIVTSEFTPSQIARFPRELIAAVVTERGSPTSHVAILARSLGIPAVVGCDGVLNAVADGTPVAVDGGSGVVVVSPTQAELDWIVEKTGEEDKRRVELTALRHERGQTADGRPIELAANIGSFEDLQAALDAGAEGAGLVRTEFLFLGRQTAPSIEEQVDFYTQVLRTFPGHRVVFRTLDIGADKPLQFVQRETEGNPALGLRGIRLSLTRPGMLKEQLRALLRAKAITSKDSGGRAAIMFPLVSTTRELIRTRKILGDAAVDEGVMVDGIEVGAMIEVPSAALSARRLAVHCDFFSIGTNDLLQYLFAADRLNRSVTELPDVCDPDVLALIRDVIAAGHAAGAWVGVCGESASETIVAAALVGLGADELSMTRAAIPEVKDALRNVGFEECKAAVRRAIDEASDGVEARQLITEDLALPR